MKIRSLIVLVALLAFAFFSRSGRAYVVLLPWFIARLASV
jgi:hypothetical protein